MRISSNRTDRGMALLVTLFIITILTVSIGGYMAYTTQQSRYGTRSQSWNMAMTVVEAGVEEALQQLNSDTDKLNQDGWSFSGSNYVRTFKFPDGNNYITTISTDSNNPVVVSRAYVQMPTLGGAMGPTVTRAVRVRTSRNSIFLAPLVAKHGIDFKGNGVLTDSFDSSNPMKSTGGMYDPAKAGDRGDVASNDDLQGVVSAQNANIYGHVHTGPDGTCTVGSNGKIGEHSWQAVNASGIEDGWFIPDSNYTFPSISSPYNTGINPGPGDVLTQTGSTTNQNCFTGDPIYPVAAPAGSWIGPISTNIVNNSSGTYPGGGMVGLTTNTAWVTVSTYPGPQPQLSSNIVGYTTVTNYPGPQVNLTTNIYTTWTTTTYLPSAGTYLGTVQTNRTGVGGGNGETKDYSYNKITSTTYTYANQFTYTYAIYTYYWISYTYNYCIYTGVPIYTTNHYDHVLLSGDYYAPTLSGSTYVVGTARLVLPNGLNMSGNDSLIIGPNGMLTLYSDGTKASVGGNGIFNKHGFSNALIMYCTDTVTSLDFTGNGTFIGIIVAGNADAKMSGGGFSNTDFCGCLLANTITMNGHYSFHYDESLGRGPGNGRYLIMSWDEIP